MQPQLFICTSMHNKKSLAMLLPKFKSTLLLTAKKGNLAAVKFSWDKQPHLRLMWLLRSSTG
jgi:hypothetical protein